MKAGPAQEAGLQAGDIIVDFDGTDIQRHDDLPWLASTAGIGRTVSLHVIRGGQKRTMRVTLAEQPRRRPPNGGGGALVLGMKIGSLPSALARQLRVKGGALIESVEPGSPAARGGVRAGDVVLRHDNVPIKRPEDLVTRLRKGNGDVHLLIERKDGRTFVVFAR